MIRTIFLVALVLASGFVCFAQDKDDIKPSDKYLDRKDMEHSVPILKRAAEAGIAEAQYNYGVYVLEILLDPKTANEWFLKSAEQGFINAQFKIAYSYLQGRGIDRNLDKAFFWMAKCADQNDSQAMFVLAQMYDQGVGTKKDVAKEIEWLTRLALLPDEKDVPPERNVTSARLNLGELYLLGDGVNKDLF